MGIVRQELRQVNDPAKSSMAYKAVLPPPKFSNSEARTVVSWNSGHRGRAQSPYLENTSMETKKFAENVEIGPVKDPYFRFSTKIEKNQNI